SLESHLIVGQIHALFCLKVCQHVICDLLVEVIAAETVVSCCGKNLDDTVADLDDRNIERTAAEIIYHDILLFLVVKSVSQCSRRRLVDDTFYIKSCDLTSILCSLALCIIKICRNCDNCLCNFLPKVSFCVCF